ncbi:MAG: sodium:proton antiporter, partial [Candidatus Cryptobacteroides sp.]
YIFVLFPSTQWGDGELWKETLLLTRFAAPTSAGILFTMLAALKLKSSWMYKKIQVLAIFDDLDTILLMIPLQIAMIGMKWQMVVILIVVLALLYFGWKKMDHYRMKQSWKAILTYSVLVIIFTQGIYQISEYYLGEHEGVHIEVLLPAFVLGVVMKTRHIDSKVEQNVATAVSYLFMFLVGVSMPQFIGVDMSASAAESAHNEVGTLPMMSWGMIALHVVVVSLLSNLGKLMPLAFYRDRKFSERLALSVGMFTRGEVGAGVIFIAMSYGLGGPLLLISVLTIVLNLILTGGFVMIVKKLALKTYTPDAD